ncbi:MepB family protein [Leucobacter albus]|uniref:MepB family protein n=1 Tax=Leucobacter albus TaxID=272210 RepID=A0ABW3TIU7_9MICO
MGFLSFERYIAGLGAGAPAAEGPWGEEQNSDYESGLVRLGGELWRIRTARVTPTKPGAFLAVWERGPDGQTRPFAEGGGVAGLLVLVDEPTLSGETLRGVFRFSERMLVEQGIVRSAAKPGKRGFRVYPSWCVGLNTQAQRTQRAQAAAFTRLA